MAFINKILFKPNKVLEILTFVMNLLQCKWYLHLFQLMCWQINVLADYKSHLSSDVIY